MVVAFEGSPGKNTIATYHFSEEEVGSFMKRVEYCRHNTKIQTVQIHYPSNFTGPLPPDQVLPERRIITSEIT